MKKKKVKFLPHRMGGWNGTDDDMQTPVNIEFDSFF